MYSAMVPLEGKKKGVSMSNVTWTNERVERLKRLWEAGLSGGAIATEIGDVTRNAVIGKAHRLGLSKRVNVARPRSPRARKEKMVTVKEPSVRVIESPPTADPILDAPVIDSNEIIPTGQRVSLFELNDANCHFPVGHPDSPDFFFCGGKALPGLPYCPYHCRIAYNGAQQPRANYWARSR